MGRFTCLAHDQFIGLAGKFPLRFNINPISYFPSIPWYFFDCRQLQYLTFSPIHVIMNSICEIHFRKNTEMSGHNRPVSQHFYEGAYGTKTQFSYTGFVSVCT